MFLAVLLRLCYTMLACLNFVVLATFSWISVVCTNDVSFLLHQTKRSKLILMIWCPDTAKIKKKMLYSSSFDALKHALEGIGKYIQVSIQSCNVRTICSARKMLLNRADHKMC